MSDLLLDSYVSPDVFTNNIISWTSNTQFLATQFVYYMNTLYKCIRTHTSTISFISDYINNQNWISIDGEIGDIKIISTEIIPLGWLKCDGASVLRERYNNLFNVIGITFGNEDNTKFNLPNLCGRVIVGIDTLQTEFNSLIKVSGENRHTLSLDEMPSHNHYFSGGTSSGYTSFPSYQIGLPSGTSYTSYTGSGNDHNNLQPFAVLNYIIKY